MIKEILNCIAYVSIETMKMVPVVIISVLIGACIVYGLFALITSLI